MDGHRVLRQATAGSVLSMASRFCLTKAQGVHPGLDSAYFLRRTSLGLSRILNASNYRSASLKATSSGFLVAIKFI